MPKASVDCNHTRKAIKEKKIQLGREMSLSKRKGSDSHEKEEQEQEKCISGLSTKDMQGKKSNTKIQVTLVSFQLSTGELSKKHHSQEKHM